MGNWEENGRGVGNAVVIQIPRHQQQHSNKKKDITPPCMLFPWQILSLLIIFFSLSRPALYYAIDTFIINGSDFFFII
jgi:hypothetical protein